MENILTLIAIVFLLYIFGMLSKKNEKRVERAVARLKGLFSDKHQQKQSDDTGDDHP